jgi:hypothetical protein
LLNESGDAREDPSEENVSVPQLLTTNGLRKPLMIVSLAMLAQQICGKILCWSAELQLKSFITFWFL